VVVNDDLSLIDYPCFVVHKSSEGQGRCLYEVNGRCLRWAGRRCLNVSVEDEEFLARLYHYMEGARILPPGTLTAFVEELRRSPYRIPLYGFFLHFVDIRLGQLELDDIKGLPTDVLARTAALERRVEEAKLSRVLWLRPPWVVGRGLGSIFFDEVNQAPVYIQGAAYMLILDRKVTTGYSMGRNVAVYAAGNQPYFAPEVAKELPSPLLDRLKPQFNMSYVLDYVPPELAELLARDYGISAGGVTPVMVESFKSYLREIGMRGEIVSKYGVLISRAIEQASAEAVVPKEERATVPFTPRSVEFMLNMLGKTPAEVLMLDFYHSTYGGRGFIRPLTVAFYTYYGLAGMQEGGEREMDRQFKIMMLPIVNLLLVYDILRSETSEEALFRRLLVVAKMQELVTGVQFGAEYKSAVGALLGASPEVAERIKSNLEKIGIVCGREIDMSAIEGVARRAVGEAALREVMDAVRLVEPYLRLFAEVSCTKVEERTVTGSPEYVSTTRRRKR
jgi:hypothetical protein